MNLLKAKFRDSSLETQMERDGFIYIPNFLSVELIYQFNLLFQKYYKVSDAKKGMWNSMYDVGAEVASSISNELLEKLNPLLENLLITYNAPVASFMNKNPGEYGICEFHRDFSILDEETFEYRNAWIPLVNITKENGALYALRGSHQVFNYPLPMFQKWPYVNLQKQLYEQAVFFNIKAGDLVVYADRTLHGSMLNQSVESRPVVHLGLLHPDSKAAYYHLANNEVKVFDVPFEFYFENDFRDLEGKYSLRKKFLYNPPQIGAKEIMKLKKIG